MGTDAYGDRLQALASSSSGVEIALGNWRDGQFLRGRGFDLVLADYLLGSTELHWANGADELMDRLLSVLRPGGYLLIVGLEPYELVLDRSRAMDRLVLDIEAIGDSAATLAGEATYRELPEEWVRQRIARHAELRVVTSRNFAMRITAKSLAGQISFAREMAAKIGDAGLRDAYALRTRALERDLGGFGTHTRARNYAMVVQREV